MRERKFDFNNFADSIAPIDTSYAENTAAAFNAMQDALNAERERKLERDNAVLGIKEDTAQMKKQLEDANARIDLLNSQLDDVRSKMEEERLASINRDAENAKSAKEAKTMSIIGIVIGASALLFGAVGAVAGVIALFK